MKKLYTLLFLAVLALSAQAQVHFAYPGTLQACEDGSTIQIAAEDDGWGGIECLSPSIVNEGQTPAYVSITYTIKQLPEGTNIQDCFSGVCTNKKDVGTYTTGVKSISAKANATAMIEWVPLKGITPVIGKAVVEYNLYVHADVNPGSAKQKVATLTVEFTNYPTGIQAVEGHNISTQPTYTLDGRIASPAAKGIIIRGGKKFLKK